MLYIIQKIIIGESDKNTHASTNSKIRKIAVKDAIPGTPRTLKEVNTGARNHPQKKLGTSEDTTTMENIYGRKKGIQVTNQNKK